MPKMKTHSGASKRFKITKNGKIGRGKAFGRHLLEKKTSDRKRKYSKSTEISKSDVRSIKKMLGV